MQFSFKYFTRSSVLSFRYQKNQTKWPIELWTLEQEMETDDDDATIRESFSLVQSILFIDFNDIKKNGWKLWGNYAIWFGFFDNGLWRELMVSLVIFSESISSGQSVLIKIWCSVEILKLIWPKKVTLAKLNSTLGSVVPLAMFRNIISAFNLIAYCSQTQGKAVWSYKITFSYYEREICQHRQLKVRPGPMKSFLSWPHGHHQF